MATSTIKGKKDYTVTAGANGNIFAGDTSCVKKNGIVYLSLRVTDINNSGDTNIAVIPAGARPKKNSYFPFAAVAASGKTVPHGYCVIDTDGKVNAQWAVMSTANQIFINATYEAEG